MKLIEDKNKVSSELIKIYEEIDGLLVIEELLLHKGENFAKDLRLQRKHIDQMALIVYGLKSNETNKLYVGYSLDRFFRNKDLVTPNGMIKVPVDIYDKVEKINNQYRKK